MAKTKIAVVGLGKIARDQHLPAINASSAFELAAIASPHDALEHVPSFGDIETMLKAVPEVTAVALCTTPQVRYAIARLALEHGRHVLLEKPPGMSVGEVRSLAALAQKKGVVLFAAWHSRFARAVEPARAWLASRRIRGITVTWKEDVRIWHPGQPWIWKAGGLGVFDPGINALSILTRIVPEPLVLKSAELSYPSNCETPIAAWLSLTDASGAAVEVEFDFRQTGLQTWSIEVASDAGRLHLSMGGNDMTLDGAPMKIPFSAEYPRVYAHFADLLARRSSDVDDTPLQLVADAFLCGRRIDVAPFVE
jgi:D-galactose 1-dehydrogenase